MAKTLAEVLKSNNSNKIEIGFAVKGYEAALNSMGSVYGRNLGTKSTKVIYTQDQQQQDLGPQTSGLGTASITDEKAVGGFYSQYELAAVEFQPITSFPYKDSEGNLCVANFPQSPVGADGLLYDGTKKGVPSTFDNATVEALVAENGGDFIVGAGLGISGQFGQVYVEQFYNGQLTVEDIGKIAKANALYAEIFFPSETSADIMLARVIYDTDGTTMNSGELTFWKCYIPTPVLVLEPYNSYFEVMVGTDTVTEASYPSSSIYSYVNATITGFSPSSVKGELASSPIPTSMNATITKWPGIAPEVGQPAYGRVRLVVPPDLKGAAEAALGKQIPERLGTLTDSSIATGIAAAIVEGADSSAQVQFSGTPTGKFYFDPAYEGKNGLSAAMYELAFQVVTMNETSKLEPNWARVTDEGDGLNLGFYSIGVEWGNLHQMLKTKYCCNPQADPGLKQEWAAIMNDPKLPAEHAGDGHPGATGKKTIPTELSNKIKALWKRSVRDKAFCYAQTQLFWDYGGKKACDDWISSGFTTPLALGICLEFRNWRPNSNHMRGLTGASEKEKLQAGSAKYPAGPAHKLQDICIAQVDTYPNIHGLKMGNRGTIP